MVKFTYEMTAEERQAYIKKKALNTAKTKYSNMFRLIEGFKGGSQNV